MHDESKYVNYIGLDRRWGCNIFNKRYKKSSLLREFLWKINLRIFNIEHIILKIDNLMKYNFFLGNNKMVATCLALVTEKYWHCLKAENNTLFVYIEKKYMLSSQNCEMIPMHHHIEHSTAWWGDYYLCKVFIRKKKPVVL